MSKTFTGVRLLQGLAALSAGMLLAMPAMAAQYEVKMLNRNATGPMVYEPEFLHLQPGDTVKFLASTNGHDAVSMKEMLPAGAEPFKGKINEEIVVTFTETGFYGIKCIPHYAMGMVMLIQVGNEDLKTLELPQGLPARASKRLQEIVSRAQQPQ